MCRAGLFDPLTKALDGLLQKAGSAAPKGKGKTGLVYRKIGSGDRAFEVSPMGMGTWAWGNQLLWGYDESMDGELKEAFLLAVKSGVNLFDTAGEDRVMVSLN